MKTKAGKFHYSADVRIVYVKRPDYIATKKFCSFNGLKYLEDWKRHMESYPHVIRAEFSNVVNHDM